MENFGINTKNTRNNNLILEEIMLSRLMKKKQNKTKSLNKIKKYAEQIHF